MLLDQEGMQIANRRVDAEAAVRDYAFADKLARVRQDAEVPEQGTSISRALIFTPSGTLFKTIADLCAEEVETRANWIWEIMRSLIPTELFEKVLPEDIDELRRQLDELLVPYCFDRPEKEFHKAIEPKLTETQRKLAEEQPKQAELIPKQAPQAGAPESPQASSAPIVPPQALANAQLPTGAPGP